MMNDKQESRLYTSSLCSPLKACSLGIAVICIIIAIIWENDEAWFCWGDVTGVKRSHCRLLCPHGFFALKGMTSCHRWLNCTDLGGEHIEIIRTLGNGAVKTVYLANWNGYPVALNQYNQASGFNEDFHHGLKRLKQLAPSIYVTQFVGECTLRRMTSKNGHEGDHLGSRRDSAVQFEAKTDSSIGNEHGLENEHDHTRKDSHEDFHSPIPCAPFYLTEYHPFGSLSNLENMLMAVNGDSVSGGNPRGGGTSKERLSMCLGYSRALAFLHDGVANSLGCPLVMCDSSHLEKTLEQFLLREDLSVMANDLDALPLVGCSKGISSKHLNDGYKTGEDGQGDGETEKHTVGGDVKDFGQTGGEDGKVKETKTLKTGSEHVTVSTTDESGHETNLDGVQCGPRPLCGDFVAPEQRAPQWMGMVGLTYSEGLNNLDILREAAEEILDTSCPKCVNEWKVMAARVYNERTDVFKMAAVCEQIIGDHQGLLYLLFDMHKKCRHDDPSQRPSASDLAKKYSEVWNKFFAK